MLILERAFRKEVKFDVNARNEFHTKFWVYNNIKFLGYNDGYTNTIHGI